MRVVEVVVLVVLLLGVALVLAFGFRTNQEADSSQNLIAVQESDPAAGIVETDAQTGSQTINLDGNQTSWQVGEFRIERIESRLTFYVDSGSEVARFQFDNYGKLIPWDPQPEGIRIVNAWAGPVSETDSKYNVYRTGAGEGDSEIPVMSVTYSSGMLDVVQGDSMARAHPKSYTDTTVGGPAESPGRGNRGRGRRGGNDG